MESHVPVSGSNYVEAVLNTTNFVMEILVSALKGSYPSIAPLRASMANRRLHFDPPPEVYKIGSILAENQKMDTSPELTWKSEGKSTTALSRQLSSLPIRRELLLLSSLDSESSLELEKETKNLQTNKNAIEDGERHSRMALARKLRRMKRRLLLEQALEVAQGPTKPYSATTTSTTQAQQGKSTAPRAA